MGTAGTAQQYHNDWIHWEPKSRNPPGVLHCWRTTRHPASSIVCWGTEDRESTSRSQDQEALILSLQPLLLSTLPRLSLSLSLFLSPGLGCRGLSLSLIFRKAPGFTDSPTRDAAVRRSSGGNRERVSCLLVSNCFEFQGQQEQNQQWQE